VGANLTYRGNAFYTPGSWVTIIGSQAQACYRFFGYDDSQEGSGCVNLGQYSCLVLGGCRLLI
jgi:hypothetical protein